MITTPSSEVRMYQFTGPGTRQTRSATSSALTIPPTFVAVSACRTHASGARPSSRRSLFGEHTYMCVSYLNAGSRSTHPQFGRAFSGSGFRFPQRSSPTSCSSSGVSPLMLVSDEDRHLVQRAFWMLLARHRASSGDCS